MPLRPGITLDQMNHRGDGRLPGLMGFRVTALEEGMLAAELDIRPELLAPNGYLHAATVIALADTACGYGCIAHLPAGAENFTTAELKSNFFSTTRDGTIATVARPVHLGNSTQVWDAVVTRKADGKQMALFRCTQLILWPRK
jgi:1,4-dihydroxy-2-naphthoyl-CoA hydrolase